MDFSWPLVLAGLLVGVSVGLTGMGGGALMTPIMVLLFGIDPTAAVGSDLAASVAMKPVGAAVHHRARTIRWDIVRWLLPTAVPAGFAGAFLVGEFGGDDIQDRLKLAIGGALMLAVVGMGIRALISKRREDDDDEPVVVRPIPTLLIGLVGGLVVGITSVGSGSLIVVGLMLTHPRLKANQLVGTDLVQAIPLVAAAALGHAIFGDTQFGLAGMVLLGSLPGIWLGATLSTKAPSGVLRTVLTVLLLASGLALWKVPSTLILAIAGGFAVVTVLVALSKRFRRPTGASARASDANLADRRLAHVGHTAS